MSTIKSYYDIADDGQPASKFYEQFELPVLEVGKVYKRSAGNWQEESYRIIFIGEEVAVGVCTGTKEMGNWSVGKKKLFHADTMRAGFVYGDVRSVYRLSGAAL